MCRSNDFITYAKSLLEYFVDHYKEISGEEYVSYYVHNLIHIVEDVEFLGPLDKFSAFRFENYLYQLKKTVKN